jgi:hypothetical protein
MPDFSLVPVDYQPDFSDVSLIPVDYDPFGDDGASQSQIQQTQAQLAQAQTQPALGQQTQPLQFQLQSSPQQPATGVGQPSVNAQPIGAPATTPGNSFRPDFAQAGQPAQNDQPTPEGGLTIKNLDTGSADLRTIPGVTPSHDDAKAEADGAAVFADPSHKEFKSTEKVSELNNAETNDTVGTSGKITDLGNGSFQVTNGKITFKTVSENGKPSFVTHDIRGNAYAIISQPPNRGPISVKVGSASN